MASSTPLHSLSVDKKEAAWSSGDITLGLMDLWPQAPPGTFSVRDALVRPRLQVCAATLREGCTTPQHVHPSHDQLIYVVHGKTVLHLSSDRRAEMPSGSTVVIRAGVSHGFSTDEKESASILTIMMGQDAEKPDKTAFPEHVQRVIRHRRYDPSFLFAAVHHPELALPGGSLPERQTFQWALDHAAYSHHEEPWRRPIGRQSIHGWIHNGLLVLQGPAIKVTLAITFEPSNQYGSFTETLSVRDIDFIHPQLKEQAIPILS